MILEFVKCDKKDRRRIMKGDRYQLIVPTV